MYSVQVDRADKKVKGKESSLISLRGRQGSKSLHFEYATRETIEENREAATVWAEALQKCIHRAASKPTLDLSIDGAGRVVDTASATADEKP
jgi:hypothetical protein